MKKVWFIISTLALANLLALGGFFGWLAGTGRLNRERVDAVREVFVHTVADEQAAKAQAESQAKQAATDKQAAAKMAEPPVPAADKIQQASEDKEVKLQNKLRLEEDVKSLQTFLVRENERLQRLDKELKAKQAAFEETQKKMAETVGSEQFKKALATLAGVKPKEAQGILNELLAQNKQDEVVSYLNAMDERARAKVMSEFNKTDPRVAADLLQRLRTLGVASAAPDGK